ncbi:MAG: chemotaxis protein CheD [Deltaproteobacteria bacterium]|nr:chemotaxis protein CheD [Deltaproteobacteria bacterium]
MSSITVQIADYKVSSSPEDTIITYALGSCIAVILYDPVSKVGGMIHYMLPLSKTSPEKAAVKPAMFADTGIPLLFQEFYKAGGNKNTMTIRVTGGGKLYEDNGTFDIGKRNYTILRKMLWKNGYSILAEDVGDSKSRTAKLEISTGKLLVKSRGEEIEL